MAQSKKQADGQLAERHAEGLLSAAGLTLVERNYHESTGEIDLIMQDGHDTLVFVEVRYRKANDRESALETINQSKRNRIIRTAKLYLQRSGLLYKLTSRFDVVTFDANGDSIKTDWIKNAFTLDHF